MNSTKNIENRFTNLLKIKNENEKFQLLSELLHLNIMNEVSTLMNNKRINKAQLARKLNVSKSYITQLFTCDKVINLKLIAQIQDTFGISFGITLNGEYMAVVPIKEQPFIKKLAEEENIPTKDYVQNLLDISINNRKATFQKQEALFNAAEDLIHDKQGEPPSYNLSVNMTTTIPVCDFDLA